MGRNVKRIVGLFDEKHLNRIRETVKFHGGKFSIEKVVSISGKALVERCHLKEIDYCNIDVEGGELDVLRSILTTFVSALFLLKMIMAIHL